MLASRLCGNLERLGAAPNSLAQRADDDWKPSGTELFSDFDYTLRADGRRTGVMEARSAGPDRTLTYDYDEINRLIAETSIAASPGSRPDLHYKHEYAFDLAGNRLTKSESVDNGSGGWRVAREVAYTYDHRDRLLVEQSEFFDNLGQATGTAATEFDYNRNGFLIRKALTLSGGAGGGEGGGGAPADDELFEFTPNSEDRLTTARRTIGGVGGVGGAAGPLVAFRYNAAGIKVSRAIDGVLDRTYLIDSSNPTGYAQVIQEMLRAGCLDRGWTGRRRPVRAFVGAGGHARGEPRAVRRVEDEQRPSRNRGTCGFYRHAPRRWTSGANPVSGQWLRKATSPLRQRRYSHRGRRSSGQLGQRNVVSETDSRVACHLRFAGRLSSRESPTPSFAGAFP